MWSTGTELSGGRNGVASGPPEPLALELVGLRANMLPVAVGRFSLTYFLDQAGEVPQAGDGHGWLAIEHRDVFSGTAQPDGPLELFQRDPALIEILRQALICQRKTGSNASRRKEHASNLTQVVLRFNRMRLSLIWPVLVGDRQYLSFQPPTHSPFDQFAERRFGPALRFLQRRRK